MRLDIETYQEKFYALVCDLNQLESDRIFTYPCMAHPRLDHILARKRGDMFQLQWLDANEQSISPSDIEDDPTDFSRSAWREQGCQGFLELDAEGAASLIFAAQFLDDEEDPMSSSDRA
jgi:hypothetical protein